MTKIASMKRKIRDIANTHKLPAFTERYGSYTTGCSKCNKEVTLERTWFGWEVSGSLVVEQVRNGFIPARCTTYTSIEVDATCTIAPTAKTCGSVGLTLFDTNGDILYSGSSPKQEQGVSGLVKSLCCYALSNGYDVPVMSDYAVEEFIKNTSSQFPRLQPVIPANLFETSENDCVMGINIENNLNSIPTERLTIRLTNRNVEIPYNSPYGLVSVETDSRLVLTTLRFGKRPSTLVETFPDYGNLESVYDRVYKEYSATYKIDPYTVWLEKRKQGER